MKIFYNILFPTFSVDCSFSAMPTKFAKGGKNSLKPAKNLTEPSELCPTAKNSRPWEKFFELGKIL